MFDSLPEFFEKMPPGPELAAFLSGIDVASLSGADRIVMLRAHQRLAAHYAAQSYRDMASVADAMVDIEGLDDRATADESAAAEVRAALRLTRRSADAEMTLALDLQRRLPGVLESLMTGNIDVRRARTISRHTAHLPDLTARVVVDRVLADAPRLTTGQLAARIRRLAMEVDPEDAVDRYDHAHDGRRFAIEANPDGTADIFGVALAPDRVMEISARINRLAKGLRGPGERRTMDQLRADVFVDLLRGRTTSSGGSVHVRVDLTTLAELADSPGDLAGYGPVVAEIARNVAASQSGARWSYDVVHPETGDPVETGALRRRPSASQRRAVSARNETCIFPGCRMPSVDCDLDHTAPWSEGGSTTVDNLAPLCRHDHRLRHEAGWSHRPLGAGDHEWTSPLGRRYTTSGRSP